MPLSAPVDTNPIVKEPPVFQDGVAYPSSVVDAEVDVSAQIGGLNPTRGATFQDDELIILDSDGVLFFYDNFTSSFLRQSDLSAVLGAQPRSVVAIGNGQVIAANGGAQTVHVINQDDGSVDSSIDISASINNTLTGIGYDGTNLYVLDETSGTNVIRQFSGLTNTLSDSWNISGFLSGTFARGFTVLSNGAISVLDGTAPNIDIITFTAFNGAVAKTSALPSTYQDDVNNLGEMDIDDVPFLLVCVENASTSDPFIVRMDNADNGVNFTGNSGKTLENNKIYSFDITGPNTSTTPTINDDGQGAFNIELPGGVEPPIGTVTGPFDFLFTGSAYQIVSLTEGLAQAIYDFQDAVLDNMTATTDPGSGDDANAGYSVRSRWYNTSSGEAFLCVDNSAGAAIWVKASLTLDELGSAAVVDVGTAVGDVTQLEDVGGGIAGMPAVDGSQLTGIGSARIATGTYTGDGTTSQSITGVGFQPKFVKIWQRETADSTQLDIIETTDTIIDDGPGGAIAHAAAGGHLFLDNRITSLDSDGFTVSDDNVGGDPNLNGQVYNYMAIG